MHGHDFSAVAFLPERDAYAAAAEEKVVRVLEAPQVFFDTLAALCGVRLQPRQVCESPPGEPKAADTELYHTIWFYTMYTSEIG